MKGDFSRFTFDKYKNYNGLLRQQGHILLDSDWNEQAFIWIENFRQLTRDLIGDFGIPLAANEITDNNSSALKISRFSVDSAGIIDFKISRGLAYISGYPFILNKDIYFRNQPDFPEPVSPDISGDIIVFVEVWQKTINYIDDNFIREPILGGPDTCLRAKLVGQIKAAPANNIKDCDDAFGFLDSLYPAGKMTLSVKIDYSGRQIPLSFGEIEASGGRSVQNLHMRLELHRGIVSNGGFSEGLKWSDENCATVVPVTKTVSSNSVLIEEPEAVSGSFFNKGDWVEVSNKVTELHRQGGQIAKIVELNQVDEGYQVELDADIHPLLARLKTGARSGSRVDLAPRLRRWSGYLSHLSPDKNINLGKGIKATFHFPGKKPDIVPGDFWTFAIRDRDYNKKYFPQNSPPDGVRVCRYPLAIIERDGTKGFGKIADCRKFFKPLATRGL